MDDVTFGRNGHEAGKDWQHSATAAESDVYECFVATAAAAAAATTTTTTTTVTTLCRQKHPPFYFSNNFLKN